MGLRHAVLVALLDEELSGYQLAKAFDLGVANFWHALPQQVYAELAKLEKDGLVTGREVAQDSRPNKRVFTVSEAGLAELERFAGTAIKHSFMRDDLVVKVQAVDHVDAEQVLTQLGERAAVAEAKIELFGAMAHKMRGERTEQDFLLHGERIGPYLTCLAGLAFEQVTSDWCRRSAATLRERRTAHAQR